MTSRNVSEGTPGHPLDAMIRRVLRESVADATPPRGLWERISRRVVQEASMTAVAWWEGSRLAASGVAVSLIGPVVMARPEIPFHGLTGGGWEGGYLCSADQYGILLRRLAVL